MGRSTGYGDDSACSNGKAAGIRSKPCNRHLPATAVIVTPPGAIAVTSPEGLTVAIEALLVCQVAFPVRFCVAGLPLL